MTEALLPALKKLQHERSDKSPFGDHVDFLKWSDQVTALLSFDKKQQVAFKDWVTSADVSHNSGSPSDSARSINRAIGILNQAISSLEMNSATSSPCAPGERAKESGSTGPELPDKLTFKWLYEHAPMSFYGWLIGLLFTAFLAGLSFAETSLFQALKSPPSSSQTKLEAPKK
jgi:hypothetical protein